MQKYIKFPRTSLRLQEYFSLTMNLIAAGFANSLTDTLVLVFQPKDIHTVICSTISSISFSAVSYAEEIIKVVTK